MKLLILLALTLLPLTACTHRAFETWDRNHDGRVSREEVPERLRENFDGADLSEDGFIAREEFEMTKDFLTGSNPFGRMEIVRDIAYAGTTNPLQRLDLCLPEKRETSIPLIIYIHGGGWRQGDKSRGLLMLRPYTHDGKYAGATLGYRLSNEAIWPAQIHDCKAALRWLRANAGKYGIDPNRIAVMGGSAGGHLAAMLGASDGVTEMDGTLGRYTNVSSRVACVVDYCGPTEFLSLSQATGLAVEVGTTNSPDSKLLGGIASERVALARAASPVTYATSNAPPFLIAHGTLDDHVPFQQADLLYQTLSDAEPVTPPLFIEMTGYGHKFVSIELTRRTRAFFDKWLYHKAVVISDEPIKK